MAEWVEETEMRRKVLSRALFLFLFPSADGPLKAGPEEDTEEQLSHIYGGMFIHAVKQLRCWRGLQSGG